MKLLFVALAQGSLLVAPPWDVAQVAARSSLSLPRSHDSRSCCRLLLPASPDGSPGSLPAAAEGRTPPVFVAGSRGASGITAFEWQAQNGRQEGSPGTFLAEHELAQQPAEEGFQPTASPGA